MALWELRPTDRFSSRAEAYRAHRPAYPDAAIAHLLALRPESMADIGAGTGISSLPFAERGVRVFAVEPNEAMRAAGEQHPRISWISGTAEATGLDEASVDLVSCFQAFHWFDPEQAIPELLRILRPGGHLAAIWNVRDEADPFTHAYGDLVRAMSQHHPADVNHRAAANLSHPRLGEPQLVVFENAQSLDREGLLGRAASTSYLPASGPAHEEMNRRLDELFDRWQHEGEVTLRYRTELYLTSARNR